MVLNQRFPGQWFQLESGLHYNWHRHYDPSLGRYSQPDPLGFVDGPSIYAYARGNVVVYIDPDGRIAPIVGGIIGWIAGKYIHHLKEKYCGCTSASDASDAYAAFGAAAGTFGKTDSITKARHTKFGGGGPSGTWTSWWSKNIGSGGRAAGRRAASLIPGAAAALGLYELYDLYNCSQQ